MMKEPFLRYLLIVLVFNIFEFSNGYFFNFKIPIPFEVVAAVGAVFSTFPWLASKLSPIKRVLFSVIGAIVMVVLLLGSVLATGITPGSRSHDYVMYEVCFPALEKHYAAKKPSERPTTLFEIHHVCEDNVWAGRDPLYGIE